MYGVGVHHTPTPKSQIVTKVDNGVHLDIDYIKNTLTDIKDDIRKFKDDLNIKISADNDDKHEIN